MIDPKRIATQVALKTLQLTGSDQAELVTSYQGGLAALDGAELPSFAIVDAIVASEAKLAHLIATDKLSPYRAELYGRSDALPSGTEVPALSDEDLPFIGVFSQVVDSADDITLTEQPIQAVRRFLRGDYTTEIYNYAISSSRIYHTREAAYFEGCVFDRDAAAGRFSVTSSEPSPLPEAWETFWISDVLASIAKETWFIQEAQYYLNIANREQSQLMARDTPLMLNPQATNEPVKN